MASQKYLIALSLFIRAGLRFGQAQESQGSFFWEKDSFYF